VIGVPGRVHVYLACGTTDMRKGFDGLSALVQTMLKLDPHDGALFVFRGKRGDLIKVLWWDGQGLCLFSKRLERGRFISYGLCQWFYACFSDRPFGRQRGDAHNPHR
jgi:transposase